MKGYAEKRPEKHELREEYQGMVALHNANPATKNMTCEVCGARMDKGAGVQKWFLVSLPNHRRVVHGECAKKTEFTNDRKVPVLHIQDPMAAVRKGGEQSGHNGAEERILNTIKVALGLAPRTVARTWASEVVKHLDAGISPASVYGTKGSYMAEARTAMEILAPFWERREHGLEVLRRESFGPDSVYWVPPVGRERGSDCSFASVLYDLGLAPNASRDAAADTPLNRVKVEAAPPPTKLWVVGEQQDGAHATVAYGQDTPVGNPGIRVELSRALFDGSAHKERMIAAKSLPVAIARQLGLALVEAARQADEGQAPKTKRSNE